MGLVEAPSIKRKLLAGGGWSILFKLLSVPVGLATNALITRVLPPEEVGVFFLVFSLVPVFALFALTGLHLAVVKLVSEALARDFEDDIRPVIESVFLYATATNILFLIGLYFGGFELLSEKVFKYQVLSDMKGLVLLWIMLWTLQVLVAETFRGFQKFHLAVSLRRVLPNVFLLVLLVIVFLSVRDLTLRKVMYISLGAWILSLLFSSAILLRLISGFTSGKLVSLRKISRMALPMWISNVISFAMTHVDIWFLAAFRPASEVAVYGAASRMVRVVGMPLLIIGAVVQPIISELYSQGRVKTLENTIRVSTSFASVPGVVILVSFVFLGNLAMRLVFGDYYVNGAVVLQILSFGFLTKILAGTSEMALMMTGNERVFMKISLVSGTIMVLGSYFGSQHWGSLGLSVAVAFSMLFQSVVSVLIIKVKIGIWTVPTMSYSRIKEFVKHG